MYRKGWKWKFGSIFVTSIIYLFYRITVSRRIAIVVIVKNDTDIGEYEIALESVKCYAQIQKYQFQLIRDPGPEYPCLQKDPLFRRHCLTSQVLQNYETVMFLDADIGVVNPNKRFEEFMEQDIDIVFYDRFQNWEVATGSYIVRNTKFARDFLREFANYVEKLPKDGFHGSDNGAIHMFLAEKLLPSELLSDSPCLKIYKNSKNFEDLFTFEACIRNLLDSISSSARFQKIKILKKGSGWVRDGWLTNSLWNPDMDFMIHGWKMSQLRKAPDWKLKPVPSARNQWFSPFLRLEVCQWNYDPRLIGDKDEIQKTLKKIEEDVEKMKEKSLSRMEGM